MRESPLPRLYASSIPSGNVYKVELAAAQLEIALERVELNILATPSETRSPEFLAKNPNGRVPLLELADGTCIPESNAILYFLAANSSLWPSDHLERTRALQWMFFEQYSHEPYIAVLKFWTYWGGLENCRPEQLEVWRNRGAQALAVMNEHLVAQDFFSGSNYGIADIALFAYTQSAQDIGFSLDALPALCLWMKRVREQPGYFPIASATPISSAK